MRDTSTDRALTTEESRHIVGGTKSNVANSGVEQLALRLLAALGAALNVENHHAPS